MPEEKVKIAKEKAKKIVDEAKEKAKERVDKEKAKAVETVKKAKDKTAAKKKCKAKVDATKEKCKLVVEKAKDKAKKIVEKAKAKTGGIGSPLPHQPPEPTPPAHIIKFTVDRRSIPEDLTKIDISNLRFTKDEFRKKLDTLLSNNNLNQVEELQLTNILIIDNDIVNEYIIKLIEKMPNLKKISLSRNHITHKGAISLSKVLPPNLTEFHISENMIGDEGLASLIDTLSKTSPNTLTKLGINKIGIGEAGTMLIANKYSTFTQLTHIYMMDNNYTDNGLNYLLTALSNTNRKIVVKVNGINYDTFEPKKYKKRFFWQRGKEEPKIYTETEKETEEALKPTFVSSVVPINQPPQ
jgi:hypothetical protein